MLAVNGEIYNHQDIRRTMKEKGYEFQTESDCEVILALYRHKGIHFLEDLNGIFAFALYDEEKDDFLIARDPIGVIPLYIGKDKEGKVYVASELKALEGFCDDYEVFLPGHYYLGSEGVQKNGIDVIGKVTIMSKTIMCLPLKFVKLWRLLSNGNS